MNDKTQKTSVPIALVMIDRKGASGRKRIKKDGKASKTIATKG